MDPFKTPHYAWYALNDSLAYSEHCQSLYNNNNKDGIDSDKKEADNDEPAKVHNET